MRIIRGKYRGKKINPPTNFKARPTTDFAKEGLFNILENTYEFEGLKILDLFSGTGSISFEFLSRGCEKVTAIEISKKHSEYIKKEGEKLFENQLTIISTDVFEFVKKASLNYDIIFADPPFDNENTEELPDIILGNETFRPESLLIIEHSATTDFSKHPNYKKTRKYGKVNFSFFDKE